VARIDAEVGGLHRQESGIAARLDVAVGGWRQGAGIEHHGAVGVVCHHRLDALAAPCAFCVGDDLFRIGLAKLGG
jgi:hypothetical protein